MIKKIDNRLTIIAAMGLNRVISNNNKLPWHLPEDLARFYQLIKNKTIVMGQKTFAAIGQPIDTCRNIIISRDNNLIIPRCEVYHSVTEVIAATERDQAIMIIGGGEVYNTFLPLAHTIYLTLIHANFVGDVFFPDFSLQEWREVSRTICEATAQAYRYDFITYTKM